ncbi:MAG: hypothetical protein APF76_12085 [Desulfitibacter sp. BRH_c19]|nr:MAG: hypothetical protein APF76_12085 [Desulfitibacter sp. BRH_c19]
MPLSQTQAIRSCIDMCQGTQNSIRILADTAQNQSVRDELNKAFLTIDDCIKQCQSASSYLS